jgi:ribosome-associated protein
MKSIMEEPEAEFDNRISRTKKKKAALALQQLGERLAQLSENQLLDMHLPEELTDALLELRLMKKHEARRRQVQYIGTLMRQIDAGQIQMEMDRLDMKNYEAIHRFKQLERWRDALLAGDDACMDQLAAQFPTLERQQLAQLVRNARKEAEQQKPPKAARRLFQYLKGLA